MENYGRGYANTLENPATRFFEIKNGELQYYDKAQKEGPTKGIIPVKKPFTFLVLDILTCIKGFNEAENTGFYSNEVRDLKTETLIVRTKKGIEAKGLYADIKDSLKVSGGKYGQSTYIAYKDESGQLVIGNIYFSGSSLAGGKTVDGKDVGGWMAFRNNYKSSLFKGAVTLLPETIECKKGKNIYNVPTFKLIEVAPETDVKAIALNKTLQEYLTSYFKKAHQEVVEQEVIAEQVAEAHKEVFNTTEDPFADFVPDEVDNSAAAIFPPKEEKSTIFTGGESDDLPF